MSEPLRTDPVTAPVASAAAAQAARIEELLLSGLDQYFAGDYEQAINVWTRVIFLERGHDRARAYIERARGAMAERQRESEEFLHRGVAAYHAGDVGAARDLLSQAVEQRGTSDDALMFLHRLNRVEAVNAMAGGADAGDSGARHASGGRRQQDGYRWVMPVLLGAVIVGAVALGAAPLVSWTLELRGGPAPAVEPSIPEPLPVVRTPDTILVRARDLYAGGHLHDALRVLDRIDIGDPLRTEADRLRGDIQRDLLAAAGAGFGAPPGAAASR